MDSQTWAHQASRRIERPAKVVMDYMTDLDALGRWSLGCFDTQTVEPGLVVGTSLFDGSQTHVSVETLAEQGLIRYWVGSATQRTPRISAMVQPLDQDSCILIMLATRGADMNENRWLRLQRCHETELDLIQAQLHSAA
ncbi:hypothetical protein KAH39_08820 [Alcaligenes faecalis]|uniref:hypothetical protein n=1 Tax=Alcaligenes faecalis TaxID=511 RepID=UPI000F680CA0|nr:hypothetical protein [Alcaligenes faecalis]MBQ0217403.1 hypothetical protein [Alcaligenes faecalis]RSE58847.1 hypothetical protein EGT81_16715 [Alcaligenes faecalis]